MFKKSFITAVLLSAVSLAATSAQADMHRNHHRMMMHRHHMIMHRDHAIMHRDRMMMRRDHAMMHRDRMMMHHDQQGTRMAPPPVMSHAPQPMPIR
jgi:hypothetical protein